MKEKHVERLTKGKKSGRNIGSRAVPHRLTKDEQRIFSKSIREGFLQVHSHQRSNLSNIWEIYCQAKGWEFYKVVKYPNGSASVELGKRTKAFVDYNSALDYVRSKL